MSPDPLKIAKQVDPGVVITRESSGRVLVCTSAGRAIEVKAAVAAWGFVPTLSPGDHRVYLDL